MTLDFPFLDDVENIRAELEKNVWRAGLEPTPEDRHEISAPIRAYGAFSLALARAKSAAEAPPRPFTVAEFSSLN